MNIKLITLLFTGVFSCIISTASFAGWIDWQNTTTGNMDYNGTNVGVTLAGNAFGLNNGDYYYNNTATGGTDPSGTYAGLAPTDLIHVSSAGSFTLTFDQEVDDLYMALVSVGQPNNNFVTYSFEDEFSVESQGANYWGYNGYTATSSELTGHEFNGILLFEGSFTSISFDVLDNEYWHGFNFGTVNSVPEPGTLFLLLSGMVGIFAARRRTV